jgi:hypothetical protein
MYLRLAPYRSQAHDKASAIGRTLAIILKKLVRPLILDAS